MNMKRIQTLGNHKTPWYEFQWLRALGRRGDHDVAHDVQDLSVDAPVVFDMCVAMVVVGVAVMMHGPGPRVGPAPHCTTACVRMRLDGGA